MKCAMITPTDFLHYEERAGFGFHFALAQHVKEASYAAWFKRWHEFGHFIMMDNGAAEGERLDNKDLIEAAGIIGADEVVMPDVLRDKHGTINATRAALSLVPERNRAMAPQGADWFEWEACAKILVSYGCATICIPKLYEGYPGGRAHALAIIRGYHWDWDHNIHLLGCYNDPVREIVLAHKHTPWIRSVDTGAPVAYAQADKSLWDEGHESLDWHKEPNMAQMLYNPGILRSAASGVIDAHRNEK